MLSPSRSSRLGVALDGIEDAITVDFVSQDIRQALYHPGEITGHISIEDILGNIFSRFCIENNIIIFNI